MDHSDPLQEMVIALCADAYIPPHRQAGKTKSYVTLKGEIGVVYFSDSEPSKKSYRLTSDGIQMPPSFAFRRNNGIQSYVTVNCNLLEIVSGPYNPETEMAP